MTNSATFIVDIVNICHQKLLDVKVMPGAKIHLSVFSPEQRTQMAQKEATIPFVFEDPAGTFHVQGGGSALQFQHRYGLQVCFQCDSFSEDIFPILLQFDFQMLPNLTVSLAKFTNIFGQHLASIWLDLPNIWQRLLVCWSKLCREDCLHFTNKLIVERCKHAISG